MELTGKEKLVCAIVAVLLSSFLVLSLNWDKAKEAVSSISFVEEKDVANSRGPTAEKEVKNFLDKSKIDFRCNLKTKKFTWIDTSKSTFLEISIDNVVSVVKTAYNHIPNDVYIIYTKFSRGREKFTSGDDRTLDYFFGSFMKCRNEYEKGLE